MTKLFTRRSRGVILGAAALALALGTTACSSGGAPGGDEPAGDEYRIGVLIKDTTIPFFGRQILGYEEGGKDLGLQVDIFNGKGDNAEQVSLVQQMVTNGYDLIIVTPGDPRAIDAGLKQAAEAGIPVIAVNTAPEDTSTLLSFVGADDVAYGEGLGELVVQATGGEGNIAVIRGKLGDPPDALRLQGLQSVLDKYPGLTIVAEQTANWDSATALSVTQDFLSRFGKGELDAIVDVGPEVASGADYAHKNGRDEVNFIVGDFPTDVKAGVENGSIFGAVNQDPYTQSYEALKLAKAYLDGNEDAVEKTVYLDLPLVTKDNVADFEPAW